MFSEPTLDTYKLTVRTNTHLSSANQTKLKVKAEELV